jgi:hypothetical protein
MKKNSTVNTAIVAFIWSGGLIKLAVSPAGGSSIGESQMIDASAGLIEVGVATVFAMTAARASSTPAIAYQVQSLTQHRACRRASVESLARVWRKES